MEVNIPASPLLRSVVFDEFTSPVHLRDGHSNLGPGKPYFCVFHQPSVIRDMRVYDG